jgi:sterol desaturase/sphingolipid hydroxylase (fatty acid hydroxylase superfamily)
MGVWTLAVDALFEALVQPAFAALGLAAYLETAFDATELFLVGAVEIALLALLLTLLERWRPIEPVSDRHAVRIDMLYTLLNRLGFVPLLMFALLTPVVLAIDGWMRMRDIVPWKIEDAWPWLNQHPLASFAIYLVLLDFIGYWVHRAQHHFGLWWALHSLHHSQRQMTFWTDDRNHLLDELLTSAVFAFTALAVGVPPMQFVSFVVLTRVLQSLQHANVRLSFGPAEALLVSPRFHRLHHAIGAGHEGARQGCNFAVLFPVWDHLFGTASGQDAYSPTGIRDQLAGRDYGRGFWRQQWLGLKRMAGRA